MNGRSTPSLSFSVSSLLAGLTMLTACRPAVTGPPTPPLLPSAVIGRSPLPPTTQPTVPAKDEPTICPGIGGLAPGDYLLVLDASTKARDLANGTPLIYAVPASEGEPQVIGPTPLETSSLAFTNDGTRLAYYDNGSSSFIVIDILDGNFSRVPSATDCGRLSWAPDNRLLTCGTDDVLVVDTLSGSITQLTHCHSEPLDPPSECGEPSWSPDGNLLSYGRWRLYGEDPQEGLHLISADCILAPETCPGRTLGPIPTNPLVGWSPDATRLAVYVPPDIIVYDLTGRPLQVFHVPTSVDGRPMWSPRGDAIAFGDGDDTFLLRVVDGIVQPFYPRGPTSILGWVSIAESPSP